MLSILATLLGFKELNIFGEVIKMFKIEMKFEIGNDFDNACDEPRTDSSKSKLPIGMTLNMREVIIGLKMAASTEVGIMFTRNGDDESSSVSKSPSRKPKTVDGGNVTIISDSDFEVTNVNSDSKVGKGRQLTDDLDMDNAVMRFIADE